MVNFIKDEEKIYDLLEIATVILVIFLVIFSAVALYIKVPKVREAVAMATTKKPETFTELYFEDHTNLPSIVKNRYRYNFSFTIHNSEYRDMTYPYEVYVNTNGKREMIEKNSVNLPHDGKLTIKENFQVRSATRSAVVVNLINKNQEIRFWIEGEK